MHVLAANGQTHPPLVECSAKNASFILTYSLEIKMILKIIHYYIIMHRFGFYIAWRHFKVLN